MKWIEMMVKKLTARYMNLNKQFKVQRHTIVCQSGMEDYVSVTIDCTESFSFDFWTKELTCEYGNRYFDDVSEAIPAYLALIMMPLTYSIANGIAVGLIAYTLIKIFTGKFKELNIITVVLSALFVIRYLMISL